jgi:hypothetical protein
MNIADIQLACRFCHSKKGCWAWQCYKCGEIDDVQKPTPPAAQLKQEPVGEVTEVSDNRFKCEFSQRLAVGTKLYIAAPAAQRKPLTDEMRKQMLEASDNYEMRGAFANGWLSAEAAHRIKDSHD